MQRPYHPMQHPYHLTKGSPRMDLAAQLRDRLADPSLTHDEQARLRCRLAKELEERGEYEGARRAMGDLWQRVGERPRLEGMEKTTQAEVLLRAGALTGWIGSAKQIEGAQEAAKDLVGESVRLFEASGEAERAEEARTELAYCYWRQGSFDEARDILREVVERLADSAGEVKLVAVIRSAIVERTSGRYHDALRIHTQHAHLFEGEGVRAVLKGKFHNEYAVVSGVIGTSESREDLTDNALVEYAAASYYFEQAGHLRYCACAENNLAMLYLTLGRHREAHEHLDRARPLLLGLKDEAHVAQVDETRTKVLLAEGRAGEAEKVASAAVRALEKGDEQAILAEALTTHGVALARTGHRVRARQTLQRAAAVAEQAGDRDAAGRAALSLIEELSDAASTAELSTEFEQAAEHLAGSQHGVAARLIEAARVVLRRLRPGAKDPGPFSAPATWEGFSLRKELRRYEQFLIECALKDSGGLVTKAARLLGYKHHYSLINLIDRHHPELRASRTPVILRGPRKRKDEGSRKRGETKGKRHAPPHKAEMRLRPAIILHGLPRGDVLEWGGGADEDGEQRPLRPNDVRQPPAGHRRRRACALRPPDPPPARDADHHVFRERARTGGARGWRGRVPEKATGRRRHSGDSREAAGERGVRECGGARRVARLPRARLL
jgi:tetratricopeptide (TPR) repeat protein